MSLHCGKVSLQCGKREVTKALWEASQSAKSCSIFLCSYGCSLAKTRPFLWLSTWCTYQINQSVYWLVGGNDPRHGIHSPFGSGCIDGFRLCYITWLHLAGHIKTCFVQPVGVEIKTSTYGFVLKSLVDFCLTGQVQSSPWAHTVHAKYFSA